jgi:tellurite resistance-related uncharacterized protein
MNTPALPQGLEHVRTTDVFDNTTVPAGLLRAHRVADGVWGRLVVQAGVVTFVFDDEPDRPITVTAGESVAIPPARQHHVELTEPAAFAIEFHRAPTAASPDPGNESTGLEGHAPTSTSGGPGRNS